MAATPLPSFSQLRAFVALCDNQHFGEAAASLGVSQPSLSQAIHTLERRVGGELVERTTRKVLVTPLGESLLPFAREAVLAAESFSQAAANEGASLVGTIRLGMIPTLAPYLAPVVLDGLSELLPELRVELREMTTGDILTLLEQGRLDAAVLATDVDMQRAAAIPMFDEPLVVLVPADHPWAGRTDLRTNELDAQNLLLLDESNCLRQETLAICQHYGSHPPVAVAATLATVVQMVAHGSGVTVVPEGALRMLGDSATYAVARFRQEGGTAPSRRIGLVHRISTSRAEEFEALARVLTDLVREAGLPLREVPGSEHRDAGPGREDRDAGPGREDRAD